MTMLNMEGLLIGYLSTIQLNTSLIISWQAGVVGTQKQIYLYVTPLYLSESLLSKVFRVIVGKVREGKGGWEWFTCPH